MTDTPTIEHTRATEASPHGSFHTTVEGHHCVADYLLQPGGIVMHHTEVSSALQGRGIAARLVETALAWARSEGLKVTPSCSYVRAYMQRHPETQDLLAPGNG